MNVDRAARGAVVVGCLYEVVAIMTRRVPTITTLLRRCGASHPIGRGVLWLWCGFIAWHFLEPWES